MNNGWDSYHNFISESIRHETSLLFQRFNYFLLMTSFLIIAFVTIIVSNRFVPFNNYYWIAQTIGISGFLLSYAFSVVNFINTRLIHDMGIFLNKLDNPVNAPKLPNFTSYVSNELVPKHRFNFKYFIRVYLHTIALIFRVNIDSPPPDDKIASYRDLAPHTWLTPMFVAYVWVWIYSIIFFYLPWLPVGILLVSPIIGFIMKYRYAKNRAGSENKGNKGDDKMNQEVFLEIFRQNWKHMRQQETLRMWVGNIFIAIVVAMSAFLIEEDSLNVPFFIPIAIFMVSIFCLLVTLKSNNTFVKTKESIKKLFVNEKIIQGLKDEWKIYLGGLESDGIYKIIRIRYLYVALYFIVAGTSLAWLIYLIQK